MPKDKLYTIGRYENINADRCLDEKTKKTKRKKRRRKNFTRLGDMKISMLTGVWMKRQKKQREKKEEEKTLHDWEI